MTNLYYLYSKEEEEVSWLEKSLSFFDDDDDDDDSDESVDESDESSEQDDDVNISTGKYCRKDSQKTLKCTCFLHVDLNVRWRNREQESHWGINEVNCMRG